jgi:salicylate---CoA ligase
MAMPIAEGTVPWPDEFVQRYVAARYWQGRPLGALLHEAAAVRPDAVALVDGELRLTYAQLLNRAGAAAARLAELGLQPGDRIVVQLPND